MRVVLMALLYGFVTMSVIATFLSAVEAHARTKLTAASGARLVEVGRSIFDHAKSTETPKVAREPQFAKPGAKSRSVVDARIKFSRKKARVTPRARRGKPHRRKSS